MAQGIRPESSTSEEQFLEILVEIRNWIRAAAHGPVKTLLEATLPDSKSRRAYQMLDGSTSVDQVRIACKMSPSALVSLANRCTSLGLMEVKQDKKRARLFELSDFGLVDEGEPTKSKEKP
jgi:hypothetical protein